MPLTTKATILEIQNLPRPKQQNPQLEIPKLEIDSKEHSERARNDTILTFRQAVESPGKPAIGITIEEKSTSEPSQIKENVHFESILDIDKQEHTVPDNKNVFGQHSVYSLEKENKIQLNIYDQIGELQNDQKREVRRFGDAPLTPKYSHFNDNLIKGSNGIILRGNTNSFKRHFRPVLTPQNNYQLRNGLSKGNGFFKNQIFNTIQQDDASDSQQDLNIMFNNMVTEELAESNTGDTFLEAQQAVDTNVMVTAPRNSLDLCRYDTTSKLSKYTSYTAAALQNIRKSPMEEFFTLCVLTIKMKYENYDEVMRVKSKDLYEKAIKEGNMENSKGAMEFHQFYKWIDKELKYIKHLEKYKKITNMMKNDPNNKHLTHRKVKNANKTKKGIKLVRHFVIVQDYF